MKLLARILGVVAVSVVGFVVLVVAGTYYLQHEGENRSKRQRAAITRDYHAAAARGEVAQPGLEPDAVSATSRHGGQPYFVRVKTTSGEKRRYFAKLHPGTSPETETWTFEDLAPAANGGNR